MSRRNGRNSRKGFAEGDEDFLDFFYFRGTIIILSAWGNYLPTEMAEIAESVSRSPQPFPENQRGLLAWLAKFRYALCLPSFATRFACQVSLRAWLAKFRYALCLQRTPSLTPETQVLTFRPESCKPQFKNWWGVG